MEIKKSVRNICVKLYNDDEFGEWLLSVSCLGEKIAEFLDILCVMNNDYVKDNDMPLYAWYGEENKRWEISIEHPVGNRKTMEIKEFCTFISEHFEENYEKNDISIEAERILRLKVLFEI